MYGLLFPGDGALRFLLSPRRGDGESRKTLLRRLLEEPPCCGVTKPVLPKGEGEGRPEDWEELLGTRTCRTWPLSGETNSLVVILSVM